MLEVVAPFVKGAIAGAIYGVTHYIKKRQEQDFEAEKFARTMILGGIVGATAGMLGVQIETMDNVLAELGLLGGLTAVVENIIVAVKRMLE